MSDCTYRISIKAIISNEKNEILLCKEDNGNWELPGGGLDHGESHEECIKRELKEEMGLEVTDIESNPVFFNTFLKDRNGGTQAALVWYKVKVNNLNFTSSNECEEIQFFNKETIKNIEGYKSTKRAMTEYFSSLQDESGPAV